VERKRAPRQCGRLALNETSHPVPKQFELSRPAFIGLLVRAVAASADFYEHRLGFRRDPAQERWRS